VAYRDASSARGRTEPTKAENPSRSVSTGVPPASPEKFVSGPDPSHASTSGQIVRDTVENRSSGVTVVVREEGKLPMHFVSVLIFFVAGEDFSDPFVQKLGKRIAQGEFGSMYRALNLHTGEMVSVRRVSLGGLEEDVIRRLMRAVDLIKLLSHPNLIKCEGMARDNNVLWIVLECVPNPPHNVAPAPAIHLIFSELTILTSGHNYMQVCREWVIMPVSPGIWKAR
jgi:hypothetical protein